jgi:hypothetical protein
MLVPFFLDERTVLDAQRVPHEIFLIVSIRQLEKSEGKSRVELETLSVQFQGWSGLNLPGLCCLGELWYRRLGAMTLSGFI